MRATSTLHVAAVDLDGAHHAELDDVGAKFGIDYAGQSRADGLVGRRRCAGPVGVSEGRRHLCDRHGRIDRLAHVIIETNGQQRGVFSFVAPLLSDKRRSSVSLATSTVKLGQRPSPVTLTDAAVAKVHALLEQEGDESLALRVAVRPGGCSGYSYEMFFDSEIAEDDIVRTFGSVRVVVDPDSAELVKGATLEYRDGLQEAGFHITNPNATRTCGCGSSFS